MKAATHSGVYRGKRVLVRMVDGTKFVDKFIDRTRVQLIFESRREQRSAVKSMTIYRAPSFTWLESHGLEVDLAFAATFRNQCPLREKAGFSVAETTKLCSQPLNASGECPEHGKVRLRPREKLEADDEKRNPAQFRRVRRPTTASGKILPRGRRFWAEQT